MSVLPPFLFRAASWQFRDINTATLIDPLSCYVYDSGNHQTADSIKHENLRHTVKDHIRFSYTTPSGFSSWSVSLFYDLVHAVCKVYTQLEDDTIFYVMDTSKKTASRMRRATDIIKKCKLGWVANISEYRSGRVSHTWQARSLAWSLASCQIQ